MPRSSHSFMSYFNCKPTGSPHLLQKSGVLALYVPHFEHSTSPVWYGSVMTVDAQVVQAFQVAALALPVADAVVHELELRNVAKIADRKDGLKHRLQAAVIAL